MNTTPGSTGNGGHSSSEGPPPALFAASFFLAGLGTVYLGPVLPQLLHEWALTDERGGLLLLLKFIGSFLGGVSIPRRLRLGILAGHLLAAAGFGLFTLAHGLPVALPALFLTGLGLGEIIASTNILAGRRWPGRTGSALALMNLFWSLGAVSTGILAGALLPHFGWRRPTLALAALLLVVGLAQHLVHAAAVPAETPTPIPQPETAASLPWATVTRFGALLFLYGGLETCLTAWLTTYALRFAGGALLGGQSGFVVLWAALTAGRGLASVAMRRWPESTVQRASLALTLLLIALLTTTHSALTLSADCVLLGLALAPIFPSTFALLLRRNPPARTAGTVLAVSGLGAAFFPWLMGVVSTRSGSLRPAMLVPALIVPVMFACTRRFSPNAEQRPGTPLSL